MTNSSLCHLPELIAQAIALWNLSPDTTLRLINVSENNTYLVQASGGFKAVLRVHRDGYHSCRAIECELAWIDALKSDRVIETPSYLVGANGDAIQRIGTSAFTTPRFAVMFEFVDGAAPDESGDLTPGFRELGAIAAKCHDHAMTWDKPAPFERLVWDDRAVFGENPTWGDWRDAPGVTPKIAAVLERVETTVTARLRAFGKGTHRFNLIHADMRLANLLVDGSDTRVIDFDDCGFGWLIYDFAAAISFIEDDPRVPDMRAAWVQGYRSVRDLSAEDEAEIDTVIMLRRMALLAWIGSHIEAPEPQALADGFAKTTARLGADYLAKFGG